MKEISLHILDITQNSIVAGASLIELTVIESKKEDFLKFEIRDNGCGMTQEQVEAVKDPFTTSRKTRRVGLGIPLLKMAAELTGGGIDISSQKGVGTIISARFGFSHIDRQPLGNMAETILGLVTSHQEIDFVYRHKVENKEYSLDTREMKELLGGVAFTEPAVMLWLSDFLRENEASLYNE
ncbi:MAG: ATP-binding protein [Clostridia bacterium]|nr:ATP-binding protein [Clostridia bacterium]